MQQHNLFGPQSKIQQIKTQSLQLNRLIQFIENKKSPSSQKLKEILLSKDCPLNKGQAASERHEIDSKTIQKSERESVAVSTRNIFVARNKTESSSPRVIQDPYNKYYKIFVTKQEILKLHQKQRSQYLPSGIREKFNFNLITNPQQRHKSNLFPPLAVPKVKRQMIFNKYEDETTRWLNKEIRNLQDALNTNNEPNNHAQQSSNTAQKVNEKADQLYLHRQKYNKSLQKLIEKAFRSKQKIINSPQKLNTIIEGIQGYDSRLVVHGENYQTQGQSKGQSVYASKGKLLSNPSLKIKKDTRFKSQKRCPAPDKLTITIDSKEIPSTQVEIKRVLDPEYKKRIIHTNREASYLQSSLKLKTQVPAKPADYLPSSIRTRSHKKALKLISELEASVLKSQEDGSGKAIKKLKGAKMFEAIKDGMESQQTIQKQAQENKQKHQSQRLRRKREERKLKAKTLHEDELPQVNKKSTAKWDLAGYDWRQSTDELQENLQLQNYVQKIVKKSDPITLDEKLHRTQE